MKLLDECEKQKIQSRDIDISSYEYDDRHIVVCGELHDRRLIPTVTLDGKPRPASSVHHMRICIKVSTRTLSIEEIEAELPVTPHEECSGMHRSLTKIRGLTLTPGFTSKVKKLLGGRSGCIHLTTLLLAMAPAALQGFWVHNDRKPERRRLSRELLENYLIDTCWVWRHEGPLLKKIASTAGVSLDDRDESQGKIDE
jgi:hypothetical protein